MENLRKILSIDQVSIALFRCITELSNDLIKNNKNELKKLGVKKFHNETKIEFLAFYLFIVLKSIKESTISEEIKKPIVDKIYQHFKNNLKLMYNEEDVDYLMNSIFQRLNRYSDIGRMIFEGALDDNFSGIESMMDAGKLMISTWSNIIKNKIDENNIIMGTQYIDFFVNQVTKNVPKAVKKLNNIEIIK